MHQFTKLRSHNVTKDTNIVNITKITTVQAFFFFSEICKSDICYLVVSYTFSPSQLAPSAKREGFFSDQGLELVGALKS